MDRLTEITFCLPDSTESVRFLGGLRTLLDDVAYASSGSPESLTLTPPAPVAARPVTTVRIAAVPAPEVTLGAGRAIGVLGSGSVPRRDLVELTDLARRLAGHVRGVDHTGVNLPGSSFSAAQWDVLVQDVASAATMYRYPTGEQWPFVLPSTTGEFATDISDFVVGRAPRFELVHDDWSGYTTWQFALWTSLTRADAEERFPVGTALPGLEEFFRSVFVRHPWPGLEIRFDLCFRADGGPTDWETGEWLVTSGGRIR